MDLVLFDPENSKKNREIVLYTPSRNSHKKSNGVWITLSAVFLFGFLSFFLFKQEIEAQFYSKIPSHYSNEYVTQDYELSDNPEILGISDLIYVDNSTEVDETIAFKNSEKVDINISYQDKRVDVLREYFKNMKSPLANSEVPELTVKYADEFGLNKWSIIPAISKIESAGCKYLPALEKFNCWGYGNGGFAAWDSFDSVVKAMSKKLSKLNSNPSVVVSWYCPPCSNPNHPQRSIANANWDKIVIEEMEKINAIASKYGLPPIDVYAAN